MSADGRLRLALIIYDSLDTLSGGYLYDRQLVEYFASQGDDVEVVGLPRRGYWRNVADNRLPLVGDLLAGGRFDVILQDELNHPSLFWANGRSPQRGAAVVGIVHHLRANEATAQLDRWAGGLIERRYLRSVDGFIFNSRQTQQEVEDVAGSKPHVVCVPGKDHVAPIMPFETMTRRADEFPLRLLFVGNIIERKNLDVLLLALSGLPEVAWHLSVIGDMGVDPHYAGRVKALTNQHGLQQQVAFKGKVSETELARQMRMSHLIVVPSLYEGFGIVYLEGMGYGLPAIGTSKGGAIELISHGRNGYLVSPGDVAELAGTIELLGRDRDLLARMGQSALATYAAHPTWAESADRARTFLLEMVANRSL